MNSTVEQVLNSRVNQLEKANSTLSNLVIELSNKLETVQKQLNDMKKNGNEEWVDVPTAMKMLNVSKKTLYNYRMNRLLEYSQCGRKIQFKRSSLNDYMERHMVCALR